MNKQKFLNVIIIVAVIALLGILGCIAYEQKINSEKDKNTAISTNTNEAKNNAVETKEEKTTEEPKEEYIGQEESETIKEEDTQLTKDEKVIELAKQTWGDDDSVTFSIEEIKGFIYYVAVKSNATVISWYEVNTDTWEISEFY